jgi:hypothetical protein
MAFRQRRYLDKVIEQFGSQDMHPVEIPMAVSWEPKELNDHDEPTNKVNNDEHPYRSLVGALQYLVRGTRPDIAFAARTLAKYCNCHTKEHWMLAKRVLKYLVGTKDYGLAYDIVEARGYDKPTIEAWCDSDYANDKGDRKSITGYVVKLNGQAVSMASVKQDTIATGTCHAETIAASHCARDVVWLEMLLEECGLMTAPSTMHMDNQGAVALCQRPTSHKATKHIEVRHLNVREYVNKRGLKIKGIPTVNNTADIFTKALPVDKFTKFRYELGVVDVEDLIKSIDTLWEMS